MKPLEDVEQLPRSIGPYDVIGVLGWGGMGVVLEAVRPSTGERLAVKTVRRQNYRLLAALRAEIIALKHVRHAGVIKILDEGLSETSPWYAMELIEGQTLAEFNRSLWPRLLTHDVASTTTTGSALETMSYSPAGAKLTGPSGPRHPAAAGRLPEVLAVYRALCEPLSEIHAQALVHRDLKPSNIILRADGTPVIMDFGLASRALGVVSRDKLEGFEQLLGSLPYIAPEQLRREFVDARADLFSIGCMLYESLTGWLPFRGIHVEEIFNAHRLEDFKPPSALVDGVPPPLEQIVLSLLAGRPVDRVGHADDLADALDALRVGGGGTPTSRATKISRLPYLYRPDLVGRAEVTDNLTRLRDMASRGKGNLVLIQGESGIGKTFLAAQIGRQAVLDRFQLVTAECFSVAVTGVESEGRASHLRLFLPFLRLVHDRCLEGSVEATERILGPHGKVLASYEPMLRALPRQDVLAEPPPLPPEAAQQRLFSALGDVIARVAAERPLMLVFDDLQWADELSLSFLSSLSEHYFEDKALILLGLYRSGEIPKSLSLVASRPDVTSISLRRLSASEIEQVIGGLLAMPRPPGWLTQFVHRHSEGNPFIASEYLRLAAAEGLLQRRAGRWMVSEELSRQQTLDPFPVPGSIRELVAVRLHGLSERDRLVLDAAAVLGREFDDAVVAGVVALSEEQVDDAIRELVNRQVIERASVGRHRFTHDKLREAAYDQTTPRQRPALHRAAGSALEARHAAHLNEHWVELAYHFKAAHERENATTYMERAAERARDQFANGEAQHFFTELLEWGVVSGADSSTKRASWEHSLGEALHAQGALDAARRHLENAVQLLGYPFPKGKLGLALATNGQLVRQVFKRLAHRSPPPAGKGSPVADSVPASRAYDRLLQIFYYGGLEQYMFYATLRTLNLAEEGGPSPELARAYSIAHAVAGVIPVRSLADKYLALATQTLRQAYDSEVDSYLQLLAGVYRSGTGEWAAAKEALDRGLKLANRLGFERRADEIRLGLTNWNILRGNYADVGPYNDDLRSRSRNDPQAEAWRLLMRAQMALTHGALGEALARARTAEQLVTDKKLPRNETTWTHAVLAATLLRSGAPAEATAEADLALAGILAGRPLAFYCIEAYALTAEVLISAAERGDGAYVGKARQACAALRMFARVFPAARPRAARLAGDLAQATGRAARAKRRWRISLEIACKLDMLPDQAEVEWRLVRVPSSSPSERDAHRAQALRVAEKLGASKLATEIRTGQNEQ